MESYYTIVRSLRLCTTESLIVNYRNSGCYTQRSIVAARSSAGDSSRDPGLRRDNQIHRNHYFQTVSSSRKSAQKWFGQQVQSNTTVGGTKE